MEDIKRFYRVTHYSPTAECWLSFIKQYKTFDEAYNDALSGKQKLPDRRFKISRVVQNTTDMCDVTLPATKSTT